MQAVAANLLGFLRKSPQFIIPIYQRTYSWTKPQCEQLWDDIIRTGSDDSISGHFIGSIVYIERGALSDFKPNAATRHRWTAAPDNCLPHH